MRRRFYLPETTRPAIGSVVQATLYGTTASVAARLRQLSDSADPDTRTYEARYALEGSAAQAPLGATVTIELPEAGTSDGMKVPIASIIDHGKAPGGVWVYDKAHSVVSLEPVKAVRLGEEDAYVKGGVQSGEEIVALGAQLLSAGQQVRLQWLVRMSS